MPVSPCSIEKRISCRAFTNQPIEQEKLDLILKAALMAPSSKRCTPWHFVVVEDANDLQTISESRQMGSAFVSGAKMAIVVLAEEEKRTPFPDGLFGMDAARTNAAIRKMKAAGLISSRKDGLDHIYFLNKGRFRDLIHFIEGLIE